MIGGVIFLITTALAQAQTCTIEYDAAGATVNDSCFPNNGYCNSPGGQFIPGVNLGWCYKTQGNLRGSEVFDRPASVMQEKPKSTWSSALTAWRTKPGNPVEKQTQQCKKRNWLGTCLDPVIMYVAQQQPKAAAYLIPPTTGLKPCKPETAGNNKSAPECSALPGADGKVRPRSVDKGNGTYTCEEELPKIGDKLCAPQVTLDGKEFACYQVRDSKNYPNIPNRNELIRLCGEEEKKGCNDTGN